MKLIIFEKKIQAEAFEAANIGFKIQKGQYASMTVDGEEWRAVWSKGHLFRLLAPDEVVEGLSWQSSEGLVPIPRTFESKIMEDEKMPDPAKSQAYLDRIKRHSKEANEILLATDSDAEGEAIGWSILKGIGWTGPIRRIWLAAGLDPKSIQQAIRDLRPAEDHKPASRAAEARGRSDWSYMFAVRAFTHYSKFGKFGRNLADGRGRAGVVSVGRVQTATLGMVVRREEEIENFVPVPHFELSGLFGASKEDDGQVKADFMTRETKEIIEEGVPGVTWLPSKEPPNEKGEVPLDRPLFTDAERVKDFEKRLIENQSNTTVRRYKEGTSEKKPPKTFSLPDAQSKIGKALNIKGGVVQNIIEDLYEQGYVSYPRTAKSELPMNIYEADYRNSLLDGIKGLTELENGAKTAQQIHNGESDKYKPFKPSVFVNKEMEHHGLIPTQVEMNDKKLELMQPKKKNEKSGKIEHTGKQMQGAYLMICKQFVTAILPPAKFSTQSVIFEVPTPDLLGYPEALFKANGRRLADPGYTAFFDNEAGNVGSLPELNEGQLAYLHEVKKKESVTRPPNRYTESSLTTGMENIAREIQDPKLRNLLKVAEGIGTPATRSTVVETLEARNYIAVKGANYIPTERGRDLIKYAPSWMASPETSALWEDYLSQIKELKNDDKAIKMRDEFVEKQVSLIEGLIQEMMDKYDHDLGERIAGGGSVTPKMKKMIKIIAERKGIDVEHQTLSDFDKAKAFLDEHIGENAKPLPPSEKQVNLVDKIVEVVGKPENFDELRSSSKKASAFIDDNIDAYKKHMSNKKPSQAQINFAKKLADELPEDQKPSDEIYEKAGKCSEFIDSVKKTKPAKKTSKGRQGPPKRRRRKRSQ